MPRIRLYDPAKPRQIQHLTCDVCSQRVERTGFRVIASYVRICRYCRPRYERALLFLDEPRRRFHEVAARLLIRAIRRRPELAEQPERAVETIEARLPLDLDAGSRQARRHRDRAAPTRGRRRAA